ncbi:MAG TPA: efflux transporter outer membrane subunit [Tepidisphaeraceae bacterium]|jgi:NodT family efflux transporter outer membrane factor (OMF) lipoprotein|nr:efflux transporter outer membrane subunit [Tepidisphaeraceae bacterium]
MHAAAYLRRLALVAPLAIVAAGCTVGPNYERPETKVKGAFDAQRPFDASSTQPSTKPTTQPIVSRWWTTFNDSQLDSLVDRAIVANLDVRQAQARVREARARVGVERSAYLPDVTGGASYQRSSRSLNIEGGTAATGVGTGTGGNSGGGTAVNFAPDREADFWQAGFDAAWELDVFGGTRRAVQAAVAELQAVEEDRNDVLLTLLGDVANNYVQYRGIQQTILTTEANLKVQQDTLELTQSRFQAGLSSDLDVARAEAQVETTAAQLPPLQTQQRQYLHRLGVLLGQDPSALADELAEVKPIPGSAVEVPIGLPSELLRRRPDIRRAERQLAAATARIGQAIAEYFPKFSLVGSLGLQSSEFSSWGDADSIFWNVGPSISWNVFAGGRIRSQVDVQNAIQEQAVANYEQAVLTSLEDVENTLTAFDREQSRRRRLASAVSSNQRAVSLSQQLYERGLGDFLDVLQAQQALFNSQDALARSEAQVSANLVALYKALGGGWDEAAQQLTAAK